MTREMLIDFIKLIKRRQTALIIALIVVSAMLIGMTIFAFSSFEMTYEETTEYSVDYDVDQKADTQDGGDIDQTATITHDDEQGETKGNDTVGQICTAVVLCVLILMIGAVIINGKSKSAHTRQNYDEKSKTNNYSQEKEIEGERGTTDED